MLTFLFHNDSVVDFNQLTSNLRFSLVKVDFNIIKNYKNRMKLLHMDNFERNGSNQIKKLKSITQWRKVKKFIIIKKKRRGQKVGVITV
jgi:hypothetical protein